MESPYKKAIRNVVISEVLEQRRPRALGLLKPALHLFEAAITLITFAGFAFGQSSSGWHLVWADEFNGPGNTLPDSLKWTYDVGDGSPRNPGWGNREKQRYTRSLDNIFQDGKGHLIIRAIKDKDSFTSGRVKTQGLFQFRYGRVDARIKIPFARGIWPAFWLLGSGYERVPWPACGEIDVMENFGAASDDRRTNHATIHGPGYAATGLTRGYSLPSGASLSDDFHVFSVEWRPGQIEFFIDQESYFTVTPTMLPSDGIWVFDNAPFFIILNLAVGGYPAPVGYPDLSVRFPQEMIVDYVRVFQK